MAPVICLDTETFYDKKRKISVKNLGAWAYAHHPEFYCFLMSVYDGSELWVGEPKDFNFAALEGAHLLSHNAFFDRTVAEAEAERGLWPALTVGGPPKIGGVTLAQWDCTANMTACLCNRRSLKDAVMFLLGDDLSKTARDEMDAVHWRDIRGTEKATKFIEYTGVDAIKPWVIYQKFKECWSPFEQELSRMAITQSMRGVNINVDKLDTYVERAKRLLFDIEAKLPWIAETAGDKKPAKPTSTKAIATKCREAGIPTPPVKAHEGEEAYLLWEKTYAPKYSWVQAVTQWRSLNKFIGTLETIRARIRPDGTLSFGQKYFGAHTGRNSGDAGVNLYNLRKDPIFVDTSRNIRQDEEAAVEFWKAYDLILDAQKLSLKK